MERVEVEGVVRRPLRDVKDEGEKASAEVAAIAKITADLMIFTIFLFSWLLTWMMEYTHAL
jgi:hypothetical protein